MSTRVTAIATRAADIVLRAAGMALPTSSREWAVALRAEVHAIDGAGARLRFGALGAAALLRVSASHALHTAGDEPHLTAIVLAVSAGIASVDAASPTRGPLRVLLAVACLGAGLLRPAAAWLWGLLLGLGVPVFAAVSGRHGPYLYDRGDVWYVLPPALAIALVGGQMRQRTWRRRRP